MKPDWREYEAMEKAILKLEAALAERDVEIKRLREVLVKIRGWGGDCDCIRTLCPVCLAKEALEKDNT